MGDITEVRTLSLHVTLLPSHVFFWGLLLSS